MAGSNNSHILLLLDYHIQSSTESTRFDLLNALDSILSATLIDFVQVIMILGDSNHNILTAVSPFPLFKLLAMLHQTLFSKISIPILFKNLWQMITAHHINNTYLHKSGPKLFYKQYQTSLFSFHKSHCPCHTEHFSIYLFYNTIPWPRALSFPALSFLSPVHCGISSLISQKFETSSC